MSWLSAHIGETVVGAGSSIVGGAGAGFAVAGPIGAEVGAVLGAAKAFVRLGDMQKDPSAMGGQVAGNVLQLQLRDYGFSINWLHPRLANLRCIDQYFSRFGYRTNRLKKPNVNTRPLWNYVKTAGAVVKGPFSYASKIAIQQSMDRGVTFWHVPDVVLGDYSDLAGNKE